MQEPLKILIGITVLILGIPIGNFLAKLTKEELYSKRSWFFALEIVCLIGGFIGLIIRNDTIMFTFFFIVIVTSRSLVKKNNETNGK